MKKVLIALLVIVLVIGGGVWYVFSNLDNLVKTVIETAGTNAVGSQVSVGSVNLELMQGSAAINEFSIANPQGFSDADIFSFSEFAVQLDLNNISAEQVGIVSVVARNPRVLVEAIGADTNIAALSSRFSSDAEPEPAPEPGASAGPVITIGSILIENIQGELVSDRLSEPQALNLGSVTLANLEGTSEQLARQIVRQILDQLRGRVSTAIMNMSEAEVRELIDANVEETRQELERQLEEELGTELDGLDNLDQQLEDEAREEVEDRLQERLGNLLNN